MAFLKRLLDNRMLFWGILALPAIYWIVDKAFIHPKLQTGMHQSGELSCYLLIVTMTVTPLQQLFGPLPWLKARRRNLGVASFAYAMLHFVLWLNNVNMGAVIRSFWRPEILPGWFALAIMAVLAAISHDLAVRRLGPLWKKLQRWVYAAGVLTLLHWVLATHKFAEIAILTGPLIVLSLWRLFRHRRRIAARRPAA